jgi:hypothetical protein
MMPTAKPAVKLINYAPYGYASGYTQGNTHDDAHNYVYGYAPRHLDIAATVKIFHEKEINI